ncbi:MAG: sensor histidine kinase [Solirubrobacteraceae bacterium]
MIQIAGTHLSVRHGSTAHHACWWGDECGTAKQLDVLGYVLLAAGPVALLDRSRHPAQVLVTVFAVTLLYAVIGYPDGPVYLALIVALATAVIAGHRLLGWVTVIAGWALFLWLPAAFGRGYKPTVLGALALAAWLLVLIGAAEAVRVRRERMLEVQRTHRQQAERRASEERLRIARELHDVLAHNISLINVQSGVALHLLDERPEQAKAALAAINDASAEALREMRSVLGVLRRVDEELPRAPTPGLAQLPELMSRSAGAGVAVELEIEGEQCSLPASVELAGFRIVQESLTNVARHAGAACATVRLSYGEDELTVVIQDDGCGSLPDVHRTDGNGIAGMRERASALGGDLEAGPRRGGGFSVRARLPVGDRR